MPTSTSTASTSDARRTPQMVVELHRWLPARELEARRRAMANHPAAGRRPSAPALTLVR
jgi:hypothetical protein